MMYAEVIIPLPLAGTFTYSVPESIRASICVGCRVLVPFGSRRFYTGIVESLSPIRPADSINIKDIALCIDMRPIVRHPQIKFWNWIAEYYLCSVGEVYKAALPSGLKVESETKIEISPDADSESFDSCLDDTDLRILSFVRINGKTTAKDIDKKLKIPKAEAHVGMLIEKGLLSVSENIVERYRASKKTFVRPLIERGNASALAEAFQKLRKTPRQEAAFVNLIALSNFNRTDRPVKDVPIDELSEKAGVTKAVIKSLESKGIASVFKKEVSRFTYSGLATAELPVLSDAQKTALRQIHDSFFNHAITLLHGVTSSGKTELYIHLIDYVLRKGDQALYLVPEIALTTQLTQRLQRVFGNKVVIYHSKFSDNERVEIWQRLLESNEPLVVVGARSSIFLPFSKLGIVIVDEEHESSYKQFDPAPRYNARDAATVLASMHGAKVLFGSATPAVETYYKAQSGKFGLVSLTERYNNATLPHIEVVNLAAQKRDLQNGIFSPALLSASHKALDAGRQIIYFHNRRGYAPMAKCRMCQYIPKCENCDVSLTYHRNPEMLECHYCGARYPVPSVCPNCKEPAIEIIGYGTERLEEELSANFPNSRTLRMDLDTTRNKDSYSRIIDDFSQKKADILVGTQMVTKGLDFDNVSLVGILNADSTINYPDFRSAERAFNMLEQVSGRAGRRGDSADGTVILQTYNPDHPVITHLTSHDYPGFYARELEERRSFSYPPFSRIVNIYLKHRDENVLSRCAAEYAISLSRIFGHRLTGPVIPPVARVQLQYIRRLMLRMELNASMSKVKQILRDEYVRQQSSPLMKGLTIYYDVDPV